MAAFFSQNWESWPVGSTTFKDSPFDVGSNFAGVQIGTGLSLTNSYQVIAAPWGGKCARMTLRAGEITNTPRGRVEAYLFGTGTSAAANNGSPPLDGTTLPRFREGGDEIYYSWRYVPTFTDNVEVIMQWKLVGCMNPLIVPWFQMEPTGDGRIQVGLNGGVADKDCSGATGISGPRSWGQIQIGPNGSCTPNQINDYVVRIRLGWGVGSVGMGNYTVWHRLLNLTSPNENTTFTQIINVTSARVGWCTPSGASFSPCYPRFGMYTVTTPASSFGSSPKVWYLDNIKFGTTFDDVAAAGGGSEPPPPPSDTQPPALVENPTAIGDTITLLYDEQLDSASVPLTTDYQVTVAGASRSVSSLQLESEQVKLRLSSPVTIGQVVTLSYNKVVGREIQDAAGNTAANLSSRAVDNLTDTVRTRTVARTRSTVRLVTAGAHKRFGFLAERGVLDSGSGLGSTQEIAVSTDFGQGNTAILIFAARDSSTAGISVADSKGNAWTVDGGPVNTSNNLLFIASSRQGNTPLQTDDIVTVTFGTAPGSSRLAVLEEFSGVLASGYVDVTATAGGTVGTSLPTGTTAVTAAADELAVTAWCLANEFMLTPVVTLDPNYLAFPTSFLSSEGVDSLGKSLVGQYKILTTVGTKSATIVRDVSASYQGMIVVYKTDSAGVTPGGGV